MCSLMRTITLFTARRLFIQRQRLNDLNPAYRKSGIILMDGKDIDDLDVESLRKRVSIVFALPFPLPLSIYDNIAYGPRMHGIKNKAKLTEIVE